MRRQISTSVAGGPAEITLQFCAGPVVLAKHIEGAPEEFGGLIANKSLCLRTELTPGQYVLSEHGKARQWGRIAYTYGDSAAAHRGLQC